MYYLKSKLPVFENEMSRFLYVSEAIEHAMRIGMPGEEFDVIREDGVRAAGIVLSDENLRHFIQDIINA